jgi:hypothetical protein
MTDPAGKAGRKEFFDGVLATQLRKRWTGNDNKFVDTAGRAFDVTGWINDEPGWTLVFSGYDDGAYLAVLAAWSLDDDPRRVRCALRVEDADTVTVTLVSNL